MAVPGCGRTESICGDEIASRMLPETWRGDCGGAQGAAWQPRFTKGFEDTAAWLSTHASRNTVSEFMRME